MTEAVPSFQPKDLRDWHDWLAANHDRSRGVSLILIKKDAAIRGVRYEQAVEEALCYGWIDSRTNGLDEQRYRILMSPRKAGAVWSQSNKRRVERLIRQRRMRKPGLLKIEAAKKDGSWSRLEAVDRMIMPADLRRELAANQQAGRNFDKFSDSSKRLILYWLSTAKRPETRQKRIAETVRLAAKNIKAAHGVRETDRGKVSPRRVRSNGER